MFYNQLMVKNKKQTDETDSAYFLKLVLYVMLGSFWLKFNTPLEIGGILLHGFPVGLLIGLVFASHDHFAIDRRIEYAVLLIITILTFFIPAGIVL